MSYTRQFRRIFADEPDLVRNVDRDSLPTSFRVEMRNCGKRSLLFQPGLYPPGIDEVERVGRCSSR